MNNLPLRLALSLVIFTGAALWAGAQSIPIPGDFQSWADANRNGTLEPDDIERLTVGTLELLSGPHNVRNPLDEKFDANGDGRISMEEVQAARTGWFLTQLAALGQRNPAVVKLVDANNDGRIDTREAQLAAEFIFSAEAKKPHPVSSPLDKLVDANSNRRVEEGEFDAFRAQLLRAAALLPYAGAQEKSAQAGAKPQAGAARVQRILDTNDDGVIDPVEQKNLDDTIKGPHKVVSILDKRLDTDKNNMVSAEEIQAVVSLMAGTQEPAAAEKQTPAAQPAATQTGAPKATATQTTAAAAPAAAPAAAGSAAPAATTQAASARGGNLELSSISFDDIFPVFHKYYDDHRIGTAKLKNAGTAAVEDIKISLIVKGYMADKKGCTGPATLSAGEEKDVELFALFTEKDVLAITEGTKALATISVEYTTKGTTKSEEFTGTLRFLDRNAMTWDSDARAAAFVTAKDPWVLKFSKTVAGGTKGKASTAVDANLLTAIAIHKALALYGLAYVSDPKSAYETVTRTKNAVDTLQFPQQTLEYKSGDCDDLSILTAALLESVGVETAFITVPGHIYVAFALAMKPDAARTAFLKPSELIFKEDKAWVPLEVTSISKGFVKAWEEGAKEWNENDAKKLAVFTSIQQAWKKYEPVAFSTGTLTLTLPDDASLVKGYQDEVNAFINREIAERVIELNAEISKSQGKPEPLNKLGVLYARYGLSDLAQTQFTAALKKSEYLPALVNMGNLLYISGDPSKALEYYNRAYKQDSKNTTVLLCIARANHDIENYGSAQKAYTELKKIDPTLATQYAYIDLRGSEATRAAEVSGVAGTVIWVEK